MKRRANGDSEDENPPEIADKRAKIAGDDLDQGEISPSISSNGVKSISHELGDDLPFEILKKSDAKTMAESARVSRRWGSSCDSEAEDPPEIADQTANIAGDDLYEGEITPSPSSNIESSESPELGEDLLFEILKKSDAKTLAESACVSPRWGSSCDSETRNPHEIAGGDLEEREISLSSSSFSESSKSPELGEDLLFEILKKADAKTLAASACVSRRWRSLAEDERLWEAVCTRHWANIGCGNQQLRSVVLALGGFRRLHSLYLLPFLRPISGGGAAGGSRTVLPFHGLASPRSPAGRWGKDEVLLSLSLLSIGYFERMKFNYPRPDAGGGGRGTGGGGGGGGGSGGGR